jgi:membrane protein YqaA with SNARE-associated domain
MSASLEREIEHKIEEVLEADTVTKATEVIKSRFGLTTLAVISFLESALPIPLVTDPFMVAAILVDQAKTKRIILITTVASAFGGVAAYFIAVFFFDLLVSFLPQMAVEEFYTILNGNGSNTLIITLLGAVTPIPYTTTAWVVGVLKGNLLVFFVGSLIGRGFRYAIVGYSTYFFGALAFKYAKKYIGVISIFLIIAAIAYFLLNM